MIPKYLPLSELLTGPRKANHIVAFQGGRPIRWAAFSNRVSGLCRRLKREPAGHWLVVSRSSYDFAVCLLALWQTDRVALLPPNLQPGTLAELAAGVRGIVGDGSFSSPTLPVLGPADHASTRWPWKRLDRQKGFLEIFTSGSTGERKGVPKTPANFEDEIAAQEATFGDKLGNCSVLSTVSHQHIYGLLFKLLWPLCAGRPFVSESPLLWEELLSARRNQGSFCLVSSPAHLDHACAPGKEKDSPGCKVVFSSAAPLKKETALGIQERWGMPVIEVFGSTETGGVGWRIQNGGAEGEFWTPFPGVSVSSVARQGNRLRVLSSFAQPMDRDGGCVMGDKAKVFPDGRFLTKGRVDRIVKIAGKRLSLDDMEARLNRHPWVSRTALTVVGKGKSGRRSVGAVIALNQRGKMGLAKIGRLAVNAKFRGDLKTHFDSVTLPRYLTYVESLPVNSQGKVTADALNALFKNTKFSEVP